MGFFEASVELLNGFLITVALFGLTLLLSIPLSVFITCLLKSKVFVIRKLVEGVVLVIRGTPLLLQLIVIFYMPGMLLGIPVSSRFTAAVVAFVINYACYFAVIFKTAFNNVAKGQFEAGAVLGLTRTQIFFNILLVQIIKCSLGAVSNETITLIKDTSLARVISVIELVKVAERIQALYGVLWPMFYAGAFYLLFTGIVTLLFRWLEKKTSFIKV